MLLNNFFFIESNSHVETKIITKISVEKEHEIFKGHFPQQAVVPGVCMIEMLKEVLQKNFDKKLKLKSSTMIKFLTVFTPQQNTEAEFEIDYKINEQDETHVSASMKNNETVFLKFKGIFEEKK